MDARKISCSLCHWERHEHGVWSHGTYSHIHNCRFILNWRTIEFRHQLYNYYNFCGVYIYECYRLSAKSILYVLHVSFIWNGSICYFLGTVIHLDWTQEVNIAFADLYITSRCWQNIVIIPSLGRILLYRIFKLMLVLSWIKLKYLYRFFSIEIVLFIRIFPENKDVIQISG